MISYHFRLCVEQTNNCAKDKQPSGNMNVICSKVVGWEIITLGPYCLVEYEVSVINYCQQYFSVTLLNIDRDLVDMKLSGRFLTFWYIPFYEGVTIKLNITSNYSYFSTNSANKTDHQLEKLYYLVFSRDSISSKKYFQHRVDIIQDGLWDC